mgnify:CR=1 FL=1
MTTATTDSPLVTDQQKAQYQDEGYFILERVIPEDMLQMMREECHYFVGYQDGLMDERGVKSIGINHRGSRYFVANHYKLSHRLWRFIFSDLMAQVTTAALGPDVYLFHEQCVVKGPEQGMKFSWHQDSGYAAHKAGSDHKPYLTCWCTLDDVGEANGSVYLLDHTRGGTKGKILPHTQEEGSNDLIGYTGDDPGMLIEVPAGSIVCFSSYNLHRSGPNTTPNMRRIYLPQYSGEPIHNTDGSLHALAVPFVKDGKIVYDPTSDK